MPQMRPRRLPRARRVGAPLAVNALLAVITGLILLLLTAVSPAGTAVAFLLSSAAMLVVVLAYLWLDRWEPEPRRLLQLAFLWGASVAVLVAVVLESIGMSVLTVRPLVSQSFDQAAIQAPFIEEAAKGLFLLVMMTGWRRLELNSLTDCLVYAGITAAGFAWMEDITYIAPADSTGTLVTVAVLRLVFAPFAHPLFTTMTGIGVFFALRRRRFRAKAAVILLGYLAAVAMHALWNASMTLGDGRYFIVVYLFWMIPVLVLVVALGVLSRQYEQRLVTAKLPALVAAGLVTPGEASWLGSMRGRQMAIRAATETGGPEAGRQMRRFAVTAVELAFTQDRFDRGLGDPRVVHRWHEGCWELAAARSGVPPWLAGFRAPIRRG